MSSLARVLLSLLQKNALRWYSIQIEKRINKQQNNNSVRIYKMSGAKTSKSPGDHDPYISVIGEFGRWQLLLSCCQVFTSVMFIWQVMVNKFLAYKVDYACGDPLLGDVAEKNLTTKEFCDRGEECRNWVFHEEPFQVNTA